MIEKLKMAGFSVFFPTPQIIFKMNAVISFRTFHNDRNILYPRCAIEQLVRVREFK